MERIGAELAAIQRIALDADHPEAAAALLGALRRTLEKKLGAAEESGAGCAAAAASPVCSRQHLLFLVHGIGRHDDFIDGKNLSWDGQPDGKGDGPGGELTPSDDTTRRTLLWQQQLAQLRTRLRGIKAEEGEAEGGLMPGE
ncbi:hypothetical protein EMIHUDRAFT_244155 [Emiliania huxleyi CCMP1516]|uniref:Uncharacterized protein n=2 Tax=Emiliania huxleyi TaxID=2903 RepID=A0A0D3J1B4_EMIH1|nr:hypothetical protein EMIHUDRAFT_244155 [Emiliania huxleyi CCMP1516]EOD17299.1 hypothetical protein EMIHUDRAFT_244155 [Emiliania huxleyi CCMP1516]|eukprot:XP_005769728.1 hypothetical protein EMIHUDRAFT_244155 [Emiliania huxleyi CCMP1516]